MSVIILFVIFLLNIMMLRIYQKFVFDKLFTLCLWTTILIWYCIPGLIVGVYQENTPFSDFYLLISGTSAITWLQDFTRTFVLESLSLLCVLFALLSNSQNKSLTKKYNLKNHYHISYIPVKYKTTILLIFLSIIVYQFANFQNYSDYLSTNSTEFYGSGDAVSQIIKPIVYSMAIIIAIYEQKNSLLTKIAFGDIALESLFSTMTGARVAMITPVIVFVFRELCNSHKTDKDLIYGNPSERKSTARIFIMIGAICCFLVYVFLPIAQSISDARADGNFNLYTVVTSAFTEQKKASSKSNENVEVIFTKLDSFTYGSMLTNVSGYGSGGIMPYAGSLVGFVPRFILHNKPVTGSTGDGSINNHPSRLVNINVGVKSDSQNVSISPLSITLWQFGYPGFLVFVVAMVFYLKYLNYIISHDSFTYKTLGIFSASIPAFSTVVTSPDVILKYCISLFLFVFLGNFLRRFIKLSPSGS